MDLHRRGFLTGLGVLFAAPAIVKIDNLMPVRGLIFEEYSGLILTPQMVTREAIKLFVNSNSFIRNVNRQFDAAFPDGGSIGSQLTLATAALTVPVTRRLITL